VNDLWVLTFRLDFFPDAPLVFSILFLSFMIIVFKSMTVRIFEIILSEFDDECRKFFKLFIN